MFLLKQCGVEVAAARAVLHGSCWVPRESIGGVSTRTTSVRVVGEHFRNRGSRCSVKLSACTVVPRREESGTLFGRGVFSLSFWEAARMGYPRGRREISLWFSSSHGHRFASGTDNRRVDHSPWKRLRSTIPVLRRHLVVCAEVRTLLGFRVRQAGLVYTVGDQSIVGRVAQGQRTSEGWSEVKTD